MSTQTAEPTFDEWKESVIAEYGQALSMDREQVLAYLAKRPYPPKIRFAALIVAFMVVLAFVQSPKYFRAAVRFEKAQRAFNAEHYGAMIGLLQAVRKTVNSPRVDYLLGKTILMTGSDDGNEMLGAIKRPTESQVNEIKALDDKLAAADPYRESGAMAFVHHDYVKSIEDTNKALEILPSLRMSNLILTACYARMYAQTSDDSYLVRYRAQLAKCYRMYPKEAKMLESKTGPLVAGKGAAQ